MSDGNGKNFDFIVTNVELEDTTSAMPEGTFF